MTKQPKQKRCKNKLCRKMFTPDRPMQSVCDWKCATEHASALKASKAASDARLKRAEHKAAKEKAKTRGEWMREAQAAFNKWIRLRDSKDSCISCDKPASWAGQWHASHYYATSIRPNLRFFENNVHKACSVCNNYMHGNLTPYREKLILKIGIEQVNVLDGLIEPAKYTIQDLSELKAKYAKLAKELERPMSD